MPSLPGTAVPCPHPPLAPGSCQPKSHDVSSCSACWQPSLVVKRATYAQAHGSHFHCTIACKHITSAPSSGSLPVGTPSGCCLHQICTMHLWQSRGASLHTDLQWPLHQPCAAAHCPQGTLRHQAAAADTQPCAAAQRHWHPLVLRPAPAMSCSHAGVSDLRPAGERPYIPTESLPSSVNFRGCRVTACQAPATPWPCGPTTCPVLQL